eukprot:5562503-Amphidinium_carterae.2
MEVDKEQFKRAASGSLSQPEGANFPAKRQKGSVAMLRDLRDGEHTVDEKEVLDDPEDWHAELKDPGMTDYEPDLDGAPWIEEGVDVEGFDKHKIIEGKMQEFEFMEKWKVFEPRPASEASGHKIEDAKWVLRLEPNGPIRCRLVTRQYKWSEWRDGLFSPASTQNKSRLVDFFQVLCRAQELPYYDGGRDTSVLQVPQEELCHVRPPYEWQKHWESQG